MPNTWFALFAAIVHCAADFPFWWVIIPKSLSCSTDFNSFLPSSYRCIWFLHPICRTMHLSILNSICQSSNQLSRFFRSFWTNSASVSSTTLLQILLSSANCHTLDIIPSSIISLMNIKNNNGPRTESWGTPLITFAHLDNLPLIFNLCLLPPSQFFIHLVKCPSIPCASSFLSNLACGTLSNALSKSRWITSTGTPSSNSFFYCFHVL